MHLVLLHFLETNPDVSLYILHQMAEMDAAVGIGQGRSDEDFPFVHQAIKKGIRKDAR
jgi:hypothetical protein